MRPRPKSHEQAQLRRRFVVLTGLRWLPIGLVVPVLVLLLGERGLGLAAIGSMLGAYSLVAAALELPTGGLADVIGRRPVLLAAASLSAAGLAALAVATRPLALAAVMVVLAGARALDSGPLQAWYVDAVHAIEPGLDLTSGLARAEAAASLGLGVGALTGGWLAVVSPLPDGGARLIALSTPFLVASALAAVHALAVAVVVRDQVRTPRSLRAATRVGPTIRRALTLAVGSRVLRRVIMMGAAIGATLAGIELLSPVAFAELLGGPSEAAGPYSILVTLAFVGTAGGSMVAPTANRRLGSPSVVLAAAVVAGAGLLGVAARSLAPAAVGYIGCYLALGAIIPLLDETTHRAVSSEERATVLSLRSMVAQLGGMSASLGLGAVTAATSLLAGLAMLAAVLVAAAVIFAAEVARSDPPGTVSPPPE